jgi:hypothetical protein
VTCIVLTKDNRTELVDTFLSILSQKRLTSGPHFQCCSSNFCEILIVDGSVEPIAIAWLIGKMGTSDRLKACEFAIHVLRQYPPSGVYTAMNLGLVNAQGESLIFMNSGDSFYDEFSLHRLVDARYEHRRSTGRWPRVVFGQALIMPVGNHLPSWLVPDPHISDISRWLRAFTPNHQTMLVDSLWVSQNHFVLDAPHGADRTWMRSALDRSSSYSYLGEPVARFRLGGVSSRLPNYRTLVLRLKEPSRRPLEKLAEICKFFLYPLQPIYPLAMSLKSRLIGFIC